MIPDLNKKNQIQHLDHNFIQSKNTLQIMKLLCACAGAGGGGCVCKMMCLSVMETPGNFMILFIKSGREFCVSHT